MAGLSTGVVDEGELSIEYIFNNTNIYTLAFSFVPGYLLGIAEDDVIFVSRMQGQSGTMNEMRSATKLMRDVAPQAVLFAVLQGIADASGIGTIIGTSASTHISFREENAKVLEKAYDDFYASLAADRADSGLYIVKLPLVPKPVSEIAPGHRLRTKAKRELKRDISLTAAQSWQDLRF